MDLNQYGVCGDGFHDDSVGLQAVLDSGEKDIYIPQGCYLIKTPLKIHSNTNLTANPNARFILDGSVQRHRGDFLPNDQMVRVLNHILMLLLLLFLHLILMLFL